jgi:hypothetical protein
MKRLAFICFVMLSFSGFAQIEFKAEVSKDAVMIGEPFKLIYQINQTFDEFSLPEQENFELISGPSTSMQQNISMSNGKTVKTIVVTYTYFLKAKNPGTQSIISAEIKIKGDYYYSNSLDIIVIDAQYQDPNQDDGKDIKGTSRL